MSTATQWVRSGALGATAGMILAPLAFSSFSATAANADCDAQFSGATEVAAGVCEVSFTESGLYTFSAPEGITKLSAVLIGAGGGGWFDGVEAYGGGGGSLYYVDDVDTSGDVEIAVGTGGDSAHGGSADNGTQTYLDGSIAEGGGAATWDAGGYSGDYQSIFGYYGASGSSNSGEGTSSTDQELVVQEIAGAAGLTFADVVGSSTLFGLTEDTTLYAPGGDVALFGGDLVTTVNIPGAGGASNGNIDFSTATGSSYAGADGAVFLRWAIESAQPELPKTGSFTQSMGLTAGLLGLMGASMAVGARYIRKRI